MQCADKYMQPTVTSRSPPSQRVRQGFTCSTNRERPSNTKRCRNDITRVGRFMTTVATSPQSQLRTDHESTSMTRGSQTIQSSPSSSMLASPEKSRDGSRNDADGESVMKIDRDDDSDIASSRSHSPVAYTHAKSKPSDRQKESPSHPDSLPSPEQAHSDKRPDKQQHLTDEQLYDAKVVVLDLLGWGVPPEYILQRGVSPELLLTVFTDLKLRFPEHVQS